MNEISIISENYLWNQISVRTKKPEHLGIDYPLARGLKGSADASRVYRSTLRLCRQMLRLIQSEFRKKAWNNRFRELLAEPFAKQRL